MISVTALGDALRKKYKTPQEAVRALGLDESLVGDAALAIDPPVSEPQRRAMWAAKEGRSTLHIPKKVGEEFVGKDKSMKTAKDIAKVRVGDVLPKSAMDALAATMDKKAYDEFCAKDWDPDEAEDESEEEKEAAKEAVSKDKKAKDSKRADDRKAMDKKAHDKKAKDSEEEEPEEVNEGKKDIKQSEDKKRAHDKKARDSEEDDERADDKRADDKGHAMDAALVAKTVEASVTKRIQGLYAAADAVRPYIGEVNPMAFDSGDAIKVHALEKLRVKDASKLTGAALDVVLGYQQKAGARPVERTKPDLAMDSSTKADALKYAPGLAKVTIGV